MTYADRKPFAANFTNSREFFNKLAEIRVIRGLVLGFCVSPINFIFEHGLRGFH